MTCRPQLSWYRQTRQILGTVGIHVRPPEVEDRVMLGHWEGYLIRGAESKSAVGVLVAHDWLSSIQVFAELMRALDQKSTSVIH